MLYNQHNLDVAKIASKNYVKPALAGVFFKKDRTVATDGYRLIEEMTPKDADVADFPIADGMSTMKGCKPFIVDAKMLAGIKLPKKTSLPILSNVAIKHIDDKHVEFFTTNLETSEVKTVARIDGNFPDYESLFPTKEPVLEIQINGIYLAEIAMMLSKLSKFPEDVITIKLYGAEKPLVIEAGNINQSGRALIMPVRK